MTDILTTGPTSTDIYTLSLHDALPIFNGVVTSPTLTCGGSTTSLASGGNLSVHIFATRSADHTSELHKTANASSSNQTASVNSGATLITVNCPSITVTKVADGTGTVNA